MKEFIEKLIGRLEELKEIEKNRADSCDEDGCGDGEQIFDDGRSQGRFEQTHKIIEIVNELAEEYKGGWIPVSERLPEKDRYVLCQGVNGQFIACIDSMDDKWRDTHFYTRSTILAWMPLPAPYKEGCE